MDLLAQLGPLAMGSRMRRLTERLVSDGSEAYRRLGIDFEPRWFPLFYLLAYHAPLSLREASLALGVSHASVSQTVKELGRRRLVSSVRDSRDERRRRLSLAARGRELLPVLVPVWNDFEAATQALLAECGRDGWVALVRRLEAALDAEPFLERILARAARRVAPVAIRDLGEDDQPVFERLNRAWLEEFGPLEPEDRRVLADPIAAFAGGAGWIVEQRGRPIGAGGLQRIGERELELVKLTVAARARGQGIGEQLVRTAVRRARDLGALRLVIETNSSLKPALALYEKLGFARADAPAEARFARADVHLALELGS